MTKLNENGECSFPKERENLSCYDCFTIDLSQIMQIGKLYIWTADQRTSNTSFKDFYFDMKSLQLDFGLFAQPQAT